jgi:hypothetical protein
MYKLIQTVGDYYVLASIQNHLNIHNNQSKLLKNKTNKKHQEIYDRGCLYMDKTMKYPIIKPYNAVFKIGDDVNVKDILNLFYTDKELRKKSVLPRPKIIKNYNTYLQSGGNNFKHLVASDPRRYVLTNTDNSYVIKIARHKDYTCAYEDEAKIYNALGNNKDDVVKMYGSGNINDDLKLKINNEETVIQKTELNLNDIIENAQYIILENTKGYQDFYDYMINLDKDKDPTIKDVLKVFHEIMKTIKNYNDNSGFFHGDLHGHNVKVLVNSQEIKVKLFDFDFSGIINDQNKIISRNITIYNLKKDTKLIFSCKQQSNKICECETTFNIDSGIDDIKKFMYQFDYFRLLLSTIITLEHRFEGGGESVINIIKENVPQQEQDKQIFDKIIKWYETNVIPKWSFCFKNGYFCTNIWETPPDRIKLNKIQKKNVNEKQEITKEELVEHLNRLRLNPSSGDLSSNFSSMLSSQPGGKKSNNTMKKNLKKNIKDNNIKHTSNNR